MLSESVEDGRDGLVRVSGDLSGILTGRMIVTLKHRI